MARTVSPPGPEDAEEAGFALVPLAAVDALAGPALDENGQEVDRIGITVEPSVHWSTIIVCAQADLKLIWDDQDKRSSDFARFISVFKALFVMFLTFAFQFILVRMIHRVIDNDYEDLTGFCTAPGNSTCATEKSDNIVKVLSHDTGRQSLFNLGEWFGIIAVMLWAAAIAQEFVGIANYCGLLRLPQMKNEEEDEEDEEDQGLVPVSPAPNRFVKGFVVDDDMGDLNTLSTWIKCVVLAIAVGRIILACLLLRVGVEFLALTDSLSDFILNSLALAFVLQIDDVAFSIFVPLNHRTKTTQLNQPSFSKSKSDFLYTVAERFVLYSDYLVFVTIIAGTYYAYFHFLKGFHQQARDAMCLSGCYGEESPAEFCGVDRDAAWKISTCLAAVAPA